MFQQTLLSGKNVVVVVGGSAGVGRAVAEAARDAGAAVTIIARSGKSGRGMRGIAAHPGAPATMADAFAALDSEVDALVVATGARIGPATLGALSFEQLQQAFDAKLRACLAAVHAALPYLSRDASITLTAGQLSHHGAACRLVRSMVNSAVEAMAQRLARELAPRRVNVISPGSGDGLGQHVATGRVRQGGMKPRDNVASLLHTSRPDQAAHAYLQAMANGFIPDRMR